MRVMIPIVCAALFCPVPLAGQSAGRREARDDSTRSPAPASVVARQPHLPGHLPPWPDDPGLLTSGDDLGTKVLMGVAFGAAAGLAAGIACANSSGWLGGCNAGEVLLLTLTGGALGAVVGLVTGLRGGTPEPWPVTGP